MRQFILAIDQGTTSSRSVVFDTNGSIAASVQYPHNQYYPKPGWVEHDPEEIYSAQLRSINEAVQKCGGEIVCAGITNQRETVVIWDKNTGKPVYNAIVWQCRRTAKLCEELKEYEDLIKAKTGLNIDAYFSGTKIKWILENVEGTLQRAKNGELLCGTIDTWLIWKLTGGKVHVTDVTNASRTMLYNINTLGWDAEICELLNIPMNILPQVVDTAGHIGIIDKSSGVTDELAGLPICAAAGDQQASMFGQTCFEEGDIKNTYGTGCFALMNIGKFPKMTGEKLINTIGWKIGGELVYALEGSVFNAGSALQWLRDELGIINSSPECDRLAESVCDNGGVAFVPAFTGLGAPYWDMYARGAVFGLTRGTTKAHICRAALEGIAFQVYDLIDSMISSSGFKVNELKVDGGASVSDFLMQFQADILGISIDRPAVTESTALGAAYLAGIGFGLWKSKDEILKIRKTKKLYLPSITAEERCKYIEFWHNAVNRTRGWENKD